MISDRSIKALSEPSPLVVSHFESAANAFHSDENPAGYINLGTAENYLMGAEMLAWLNESMQLSEHDLHYGEFRGVEELREVLAGFLRELSGLSGAKPDNVVIGNGVSSLLESLAFSLFDAGDSVIIPAPYYTGYEEDFSHRFSVKIIPAHMNLDNEYDLDVNVIEQVYLQAIQRGETVKAILINNPNNPLGKHYPRKQLEAVVAFASTYKLQIIADEIYAHSIFNNARGEYESLLSIGANYKESIHVLYGLAKDFGLSGFKFAFVYSENINLIKALSGNAYFYNVSTLTQSVVTHLFSDLSKVEVFLSQYKKKLCCAHNALLQINSDTINSPILPAQGGHFVFIDLACHLSSRTHEAELSLYQQLWQYGRVNITPGQYFCCAEPGWFRVCFANNAVVMAEAFSRLARVVSPLK